MMFEYYWAHLPPPVCVAFESGETAEEARAKVMANAKESYLGRFLRLELLEEALKQNPEIVGVIKEG